MVKEIPAATMRELRSVLIRWALLLGLLGAFAIWATCRMTNATPGLSGTSGTPAEKPLMPEPEIDFWTCTMHPQIHQADPGKCPICGMKLVEKYVGSDEPGVNPKHSPMDSGTTAMHVDSHETSGSTKPKLYRCTMPECGDQGSTDPNSRCPVCGMKRGNVDAGGNDAGDFEVTLSDRARRLAEVETTIAKERLLFKHIRTVGRVGYDETRYKMVSAWMDGRIDKLFADFTGMTVSKSDHLVEIYSPDLLSAQEEYLQAVRSTEVGRNAQTTISRRSSGQILASARRKLDLLGITADQISAIEKSGQPQTHLVIYAPIGGTILKKQAMEGMYVKTGDALYTIADLTHLWLLVDLYESDLPWVKPFQQVRVTTRSLPDEVFTGRIVFVDPSVDVQTRTVQVRIHVKNPDMRLKPDMWVTAEIDAGMTDGGSGAVPGPDGKYACPMHPWETSDAPGHCPICDMTFVAVESLPNYATPIDPAAILAVPRSAVMQTGERALVYVEATPGSYHGVAVTIGPLASDETGDEFYPIISGLSGSESIVTRGNFAIDSQMQLAGKPSLFATRAMGGGGHNRGAHSTTSDAGDRDMLSTAETQTHCPVMGNEIEKEVYTDFHGVRIYFCCPPCIEKFEKTPDEYISKLPQSLQDRLAKATDAGGRK